MTEKLLQYIWQFQYFNINDLQTEEGELLIIEKQGLLNKNQGADFLDAIIKINNVKLVGNIELHVTSSDWLKHQHSKDKNYQNIILHVVWENDANILLHQTPIPTLALQNRVAKILLQQYQLLMNEKQTIACSNCFPNLSPLVWEAWGERLVIERLQEKSEKILTLLTHNKNHWEETFWQLIASNFGIKVNAGCFEQMAKNISITILAKHKNQIHQLEAMLMGQANLLNDTLNDQYSKMLQKEYAFLSKKYQFKPNPMQPMFLRMRPAAFPTIRLAQLAMLIHNSSHIFSKILELHDVQSIKKLLSVTANDYWHTHYKFDEVVNYKPKKLGNDMMNNLMINTIIPIVFAYGLYKNANEYKQKSINWLQQLSAEDNNIIKQWKGFNLNIKSAFHSQALIQLTNHYCKKKRCLHCTIGNKIFNKAS